METEQKIRLTIFTPTFNRANLLPRLYESLCAQSLEIFEWLIIDDGSTDGTESLIQEIIAENRILIRYMKKPNGGKHTAHNLAIQKARGEFFFCVDSDDWLPADAVKNILLAVQHMKDSDYALFGYKDLENGELLCTPFETVDEHCSFYEMQRKGVRGEFAIVMRLDIIRQYPFPEVPGENFSTEAILYDLLDLRGYTVYSCPQVLTTCEYQPDGLTSNIYSVLQKNPVAYQIYHMQRLDLVCSWKERLCHAVKYQVFKRISRNRSYIYQGRYRLLAQIAALPALLAAYYYRWKVHEGKA